MPTPTTKQSFYRTSLAETVTTTGATTFKLTGTLPTATIGRLVVSATDTSRREVIYYSSLDVGLNGVVVANATDRGLDTTTAQTHTAGEAVQMNMTASDYNDLADTINGKPDNLTGCDDVDVTDQAAGRLLQWNATSSKHEYVDPPTLGAAGIATQAEAEAAANNTQLMTPLRVKQARDINLSDQSTAETGTDNTKIMTPLRVKQARDINLSDQSTAEAGIDNTKLMTPLRTAQAITALASTAEDITQTTGEAINGSSTPVPVAMYTGTTTETQKITNDTNDSYSDAWGVNWSGQTFLTDATTNRVSKVSIEGIKSGTPSGNLDVSLYATSSGVPTGSALATKSILANTVSGGDTYYDFTFATEVTVSPSTMYAIVISVPSGVNGNEFDWRFSTTSTYANGQYIRSTNSGSSWTATSTRDFSFKVYGRFESTTYKIYKADANDTNKLEFVGFTTDNVAADASINVRVSGKQASFSGLTIGKKYYVQDAVGTIGATAGTNSIPVGIAVSATEIIVDY